MLSLTGCISSNNKGTGFYVVNAEGSALIGCISARNNRQNIFIHSSNRVVLSGCESTSGANVIVAGNSKAGILVYDSDAVIVTGCISSNSDGATQQFGISFTGRSAGCQVIGGHYDNNIVAPYDMGKGNKLIGV
jgi:TATA-box binding protein (TBP) (component of TFIID and TFIIIB)